MGKKPAPRRLADNEAKAVLRNLRCSPQKVNVVLDSIRGKSVEAAHAILAFSKRRVAKDVLKLLDSVTANAENNHQLNIDQLVVKEAHVGKGLVMKRFRPRARGRVGKILKPFSHVTIVVAEQQEEAA